MPVQRNPTQTPVVPVSWGELIDKITILEIKADSLKKQAAVRNVRRELRFLSRIAARTLNDRPGIKRLKAQLKTLNRSLWDVEDHLRAKEAQGAFDTEFVALARAVYRTNDERADIKRQINRRLSSLLCEEKQYSHY